MAEHRDTAPLLWTVPVRDPFNRQREFGIDVRDGRVVLLPPPGEGCTLSPDQVTTMIESLHAAKEVAEDDDTPHDTTIDTTTVGARTGAAHDARGAAGSTPTPRLAGSTTTPPPAAVTPAAGSVEMRHSA